MHYWCEACEVWGKGEACWCCGTLALVTRGPVVDTLFFGLQADPNAHHRNIPGWTRSTSRHGVTVTS